MRPLLDLPIVGGNGWQHGIDWQGAVDYRHLSSLRGTASNGISERGCHRLSPLWKPQLAFLPVETVVHDRTANFCTVIGNLEWRVAAAIGNPRRRCIPEAIARVAFGRSINGGLSPPLPVRKFRQKKLDIAGPLNEIAKVAPGGSLFMLPRVDAEFFPANPNPSPNK